MRTPVVMTVLAVVMMGMLVPVGAADYKKQTQWVWETQWVTRRQMDNVAERMGFRTQKLFGATFESSLSKSTARKGVVYMVQSELEGVLLEMLVVHEECHRAQIERGVFALGHNQQAEKSCVDSEIGLLKARHSAEFRKAQNSEELMQLLGMEATEPKTLFLDRIFRHRDAWLTSAAAAR